MLHQNQKCQFIYLYSLNPLLDRRQLYRFYIVFYGFLSFKKIVFFYASLSDWGHLCFCSLTLKGQFLQVLHTSIIIDSDSVSVILSYVVYIPIDAMAGL